MKKLCLSFLSVTTAVMLSAQCTNLFFSEYVEGSSNNKALEIFNPTGSAVSLNGYKIIQYNNGAGAPTSTFNLSGSVSAGDVFVICNASAANYIKATADTATGNAVFQFNGNDVLALVSGSDTLDRIGQVGLATNVAFDTTSGQDRTYVRKPSVQEGTKDWSVGQFQWIAQPKDSIFLGSHTMDACGAITDTVVRFSPSSLTVNESVGTASVNVVLNTASQSTSFSVDVELTGGTGTADDISNFSSQTITFPAGSSSQAFTLTINDDILSESAETFTLKLRNATNGLLIGTDSVFTLTIAASDAPVTTVTIAQIAGVDSTGYPDSVGKKVTVSGTVLGINLRATGLQFFMHDGTAGIQAFSPASGFGYPVAEGDVVEVTGEVGFFAGMTQLVFLDTVKKTGTGTLPVALVIQDLNEDTESELVKLTNVQLDNAAQWDTVGNPSGFSATVTDGVGTWTVRVDEQTNIFKTDMPAPPAKFNITGIGAQFDNSSPYNTGYQIMPRYISDIELISGTENLSNLSVRVFPNPNNGNFAVNFGQAGNHEYVLANLNGQVIVSGSTRSAQAQITTNNLSAGIYILNITSDKGVVNHKIQIK